MNRTAEILERLEAIESKLDAMSGSWPEWMTFDVLSRYSGIPTDTLRRFVRRKSNPLPCSQPGGPKGLVRVSRLIFDRWMAEQPRNGALPLDTVDAMVEVALATIPQDL